MTAYLFDMTIGILKINEEKQRTFFFFMKV